MVTILNLLLVPAALALLAVTVFLAAEVVASFGAHAPGPPPPRARGRLAVVIPAHNEQAVVAATVAAVRAEIRDVDRIIVVADNCDDETAARARPVGADAIERKDRSRCGKGYALQFGVDHLRHDPPEIVVFLDADCRPAPGAIARIAERAAYLQRPVQALYLMKAPEGAAPKAAVSAFAWLLMNRVRMSGLQQLSGATRLTGSGMAFPWRLISDADLASGEIVEDLALTLKMIDARAPPFLDLGAIVESELARSETGAATQRARWELGSLAMAARKAPALLARGFKGDGKALAMAFDLAVPPLTVLTAAMVALLFLSLIAGFAGAMGPLRLVSWSALIFAMSVAMAWAAYGREVLPPARLKAIGAYLLGKARVYGAEGRKSAERWTRTDRDDEP
jgi:cellulose synthase/poly-beta-1,6-N-acetylglucosamine synthase-like glycosyltransferase